MTVYRLDRSPRQTSDAVPYWRQERVADVPALPALRVCLLCPRRLARCRTENQTLNPTPCTLNSQPHNLYPVPQPYTLHPVP